MIKLSIIIPVFNTLSYTKRCLGYIRESLSLVNNDDFRVFMVVVDDGSSDGTSEWIKQNYPEVELCYGNGNLWWSGGVNMGIKHAINMLESDYILLWNNDIRPASDYFTHLLGLLQNNPPNHLLLSKIFVENLENNIICSMGGNFNSVTGKHSLIGFGQPENSFKDPGLEINWFPGMGTIIHHSVFDKIGYFDDKYFPQYLGDSDFGLRAYKNGFKLILCTELKIWNDRENTGYSNHKNFKVFIKSLTSLKSNNNIYRDILFYHRYGTSCWVYTGLIRKYFKYIGGYFKWKFLGFFGLKRIRKY